MGMKTRDAKRFRPAKKVGELKTLMGSLRNVWSEESLTSLKGVVYIAERLSAIEALIYQMACDSKARLRKPAKKARKPSQWQRFFADGSRAGKSAKQIADEWKKLVG